tara:strand:+ start:3293 stop:3607 length:315 start_codon:yes stop_codon:yes gene_type:complete
MTAPRRRSLKAAPLAERSCSSAIAKAPLSLLVDRINSTEAIMNQAIAIATQPFSNTSYNKLKKLQRELKETSETIARAQSALRAKKALSEAAMHQLNDMLIPTA